jgi:gliding motility-associated-like protein
VANFFRHNYTAFMRLKLLRHIAVIGCLFFFSANLFGQAFSFNCTRDTIIPGCSPTACFTVKGLIPDLKGLSTSYTINPASTVPGCAPVYVQPNDPAGLPTGLNVDDTYSGVIPLSFPFPFFGTTFNSLIVSANGVVSFDISKANGSAHYAIPNDLPSTSYDRAIIMGPYHDLDPSVTTSPNRRIQYQEFGLAPHRRWVFSFYKIPLYSTGGVCSPLFENTHQIILYESTGIVEVTIFSKQICTSWQGGKAMIGMQDFNRIEAIMAPNRRASDPPWGSVGMNESWRFVPSSGFSLFRRVELHDITGTLLSTGTTINLGNGTLEASFPNVCPPVGATTSYIIKSFYTKIDNPAIEIMGADTVRVTKGPPGNLNAVASSTATACGPGTGTIVVAVPPGSGALPYQYSINGGPLQLSNIFTGLIQGTYSIHVQDQGGCTSDFTTSVTQNNTLAANTSTTATSCAAVSNGSITITPTSGVAPFTYRLDGGAPQTGGSPFTFTNVASGSHNIIFTDASGCISNPIPVMVAVGQGILANISPTSTSCNGAANGTISITPTSGTAPFRFSLDGGAPQTGTVPYTFTNITAGAHTITVSDAQGCISNPIPVTVFAGPALTTTASKTDVLCNGGTTGSITVAVPTIGTATYQYSLDNINWQASNVFTGLAANTYTVYFRESNGCQGSTVITVAEPTLLAATSSAVPVICNGQNNGIITVTPTGGVLPYQYSIDGGANWQSSNVFNVSANNYTVLVMDANQCTIPQPIVVIEPILLTATAATTNASCDGGNDGTITVAALGGNTSYEYSIDGGTNWQASSNFSVAPGPYTVRVRDNLGCNYQFTTTVGLTNNLTFTPQIDPVICESKSTQLQLLSNATDYAWTPATGLSNATIANPVANPIVTTQYTVTATLGRCSANDIVVVNVNAAPIPDAGQDAFICYGQTYTLQGSGGVQYTWTPSTYLSSTSGATPVSNPLKNITYTLAKVIDANGCESLITDNIVIDVTPPIKVTTFPYDTIGYPGDKFELKAVAAVPNANIFSWSPATRLSNGNIFNPVVTIGNINDDIVYQVTASTAAGCKGEGYVRVRVYKGPDVYVPTGFTPNGDGRNDKFTPFPVGMKSLAYFKVFNRWGQQIFSTTRLNDGWDGTLGGVEQPAGTYAWMIQGLTKDNKTITKKGTITLIR